MDVELELDSKELMIWVAEHPYEDALGKKSLQPDVYIGIEDLGAEQWVVLVISMRWNGSKST